MEKAQAALDSVVDSVKNVAIGEKKPKVKKQKGGDSGEVAGIHSVLWRAIESRLSLI